MFCTNCGREGKEGELFCGGCGAPKGQNVATQPVQSVPVQQVQPVNIQNGQPNKKKVPTWVSVLLIMGVTFLVVAGGFIGFICLTILSVSEYEVPEQTRSYVNISGDEIPTIYEVIGEYEMCQSPIDKDYGYKEYTNYDYCDSDMDSSILDEYADYLVDDYGFEEYEIKDDRRVVFKKSIEEGYIIQVTVFYYRESVEYTKIIEEDFDETDNSL